jgi:hypothetical protein
MTKRSLLLVALLSLPFALVVGCAGTVDTGTDASSDSTADVDPQTEACTFTKSIQITSSFSGLFGGQCLPEAPIPSATGGGCVTIVGWEPDQGTACSCDAAFGRRDVAATSSDALAAAQKDPSATSSTCFCELDELVGDAAATCQNHEQGEQPRSGFCYVDATSGDGSVIKDCPSDETHLLHVVGAASTLPPGTASQNFTFSCNVACR